jgi:hypothetical protein
MVKIYTVKVVAAKLNNKTNNSDKCDILRCGGDDLFLFLRITQVRTQTLNMQVHSPLRTYVRKPYFYVYLQKIVPHIDEVSDGDDLWRATQHTPKPNENYTLRP